MEFFNAIGNMLWRFSLKYRQAQPGKILLAVQKQHLRLRLFFVDRQRQLENIACDVVSLFPTKVILKSSKRFLPDVLKGERCSLYVKIPHHITKKYIGIVNPAVRHGFLFKSRILANYVDPVSKECIVELTMPHSYVQRDLQRHERVSPTPLMLKEMSLWPCGKRLPYSPHDLPDPAFSCRNGEANPSAQLINLSAGGLRVQLDILADADNPRKDLKRPMVLHLVLYKPMRKELSVWVVCTCVKVHFSSQLKILTLFLKFVRVWDDPDEGGRGWLPIEREGVPAIETWVDNDYCMLLDKKRRVSDELCRCFGLDGGKVHRKNPCSR